MTLEEYIRRRGYDPRVIPTGDAGPVRIECFPVFIPPDFEPSALDGPHLNWRKNLCPGQRRHDGFRPRWGAGFFAARGKHLHAAVDIMAAEGAHVLAPSRGTIPKSVRVGGERRPGAGTSARGGHYVFLVDEHGWEWYFAHLRDAPEWDPSGLVPAGAILGYVGRTGNASRRYGDGGIRGCPHLHLRLGRQLWTPGVARKYDLRPLLDPLYDAGAWRG